MIRIQKDFNIPPMPKRPVYEPLITAIELLLGNQLTLAQKDMIIALVKQCEMARKDL